MATEVKFDPSGAALKAEVRCGHAQAGAYILKIWKANNVVQKEEGTFFDPDDDTYELTGSIEEQAGRLVQCTATVELIPPIKQYALLMTIRQGNQQIGALTFSGETDAPQITSSLFAKLVAKDEGGTP